MSTKAIREALRWMQENSPTHSVATVKAHEARAELEAIEKACRFMATVDTSAALTPEGAKEAAAHLDLIEAIATQPK